jgi:hypothetical protein
MVDEHMFYKSIKYVLLAISITLYIISLYCKGIGADYFAVDITKYEIETGFEILGSGWIGALAVIIAWYANLLYLPAIIFFLFKKRFSFYIALPAVIIGATMFIPGYHFTYYVGAYLWFASLVFLLWACIELRARESSKKFKSIT